MTTKLSECPVFIDLKAQVDALSSPDETCETFCPVVVGEAEGVDGPLNLNPVNDTPVTWGGWQSQDESVVATSGTDIRIASGDVCAAQISASVTFVNDGTTTGTGNAQRAHPELWLLKGTQKVALGQTYIRDANGQDSDTATISWWDTDPVAGTVYSLVVNQDSIDTTPTGQATSALEVYSGEEIVSYLQVAAHRRFELCRLSES